MGKRKRREPGPQQHAEGEHGEKTRRHLMNQLQAGGTPILQSEKARVNGRHRLHEDRQQHDEAEKNSEKERAIKEIQRGDGDASLIAHARAPREDLT